MRSPDDPLLTLVIPQRLDAVCMLPLAARMIREGYGQKALQITIEDGPAIGVVATAYLNPAFESGTVHGRALLEFVGLRADANRLCVRQGKQTDDIRIDDFGLPLVAPATAIAECRGDERPLVFLLSMTNKRLLHITEGAFADLPDDDLQALQVASQAVINIVISHVYAPLGLPAPASRITIRRR